MAKNIIFFCAHDDDLTISSLGTVLKYVDEGKFVIDVIFSPGEKSHPHFKEEIIINIRKKEMEKIAKKIGIQKLTYLDLKDLKLTKEVRKQNVKKEIKEIIEKYKPEKIFTLSSTETHPDHRAVHRTILSTVDSFKEKYPVYTFNIWTTPSLPNQPIMYVDISKYFWKKIKILKQHKSQWFSIYLQLLPVIFRAKYYGYKNNCKYAEKFEKVR